MRIHALAAVVFCVLFSCSCASKTLPPLTEAAFAGFEGDEQWLWRRSAEQVAAIGESGFLYVDDSFEEYLNAVARKLQPEDVYRRMPFQVRVIRSPFLNAFALPNGAIYIHTGMLAAMDNEAQLATVLAHEMTHATHRHAIRKRRDWKGKAAVMSSLVVATGGLAAIFNPVATASALGYSRDLEREADREGFSLTMKAGYDAAEAVRVFELMKREIEGETVQEPFFFGTHPRIVERIEAYRELLAGQGARGGFKGGDVYQSRVKQLILENAQLNITFGRYERAEAALRTYAGRYPEEGNVYYLLGETLRKRGGAGQEKMAEMFYRRTLALDPNHAAACKMLGMILFKAGDLPAAKGYFERYLLLNGSAADRAYIEDYIRRAGPAPRR